MKRLIDLTHKEARAHFLKGSCYFNGDLPKYISFEPILNGVSDVLKGANYAEFMSEKPNELPNVNYSFIANKDGRFSWRPYELMHPVIYVSLVNVICEDANWESIRTRLKEFEGGVIECCSAPVMSIDHQTDVATQIKNWWQSVEQRSLTYSLEFSHLILPRFPGHPVKRLSAPRTIRETDSRALNADAFDCNRLRCTQTPAHAPSPA